MKKLFTLILASCIALSLAACAAEGASSSISQGANSVSGENKPLSVKSHMGKVTSVAGNEIEINLVKEPEMPEIPESNSNLDGEMSAAIALTPAIGAEVEGGTGAAQRTEIELSGEMKAFIIPAGMPVNDAMGNEKQLSDIKKGSLLNVMVDDEDNVTEVFLYE